MNAPRPETPGPEAPFPLDGWTPWPADLVERYRRAGYWRGETFGGMLRDRAVRHPDRAAVTDGGRRWTYAELDDRADRLAAGLRARGIRRGDRVIVQLPNVAEFFQVCFALFRLGALPVFALPAHRHSEIEAFGEQAEAVAYVIPAGESEGFDYRPLARRARDRVPSLRLILEAGPDAIRDGATREEITARAGFAADDVSPQDVAFLQLSGGSTGTPKLIPRTHDEYLYTLRASAEICGLRPGSVYLAALPVAHNFPMSSPGVFGTLYAGGRVVLARRPSPDEAFPLIARERVTITAVVPPLALVWIEAARRRRDDLSSLELFQVGGARFEPEAARRIRPAFGCPLQQVFGMAEGLVNYTRLDDPEEIIVTTQGRPISPDDEIRVVDDDDEDLPPGQAGHLLTRGPYTIRGYYRASAHNAVAFTPDGFYRTGDIARVTPTGHLVVEGRFKDQINRGGDKVPAPEVENHLLAHPGVRDAAVVAVPDPYLGERSCAFVIAAPDAGGEPPSAAALKAFLRERGLATFKVPDRIEFAPAFPVTGAGKVSKKKLREIARASATTPTRS